MAEKDQSRMEQPDDFWNFGVEAPKSPVDITGGRSPLIFDELDSALKTQKAREEEERKVQVEATTQAQSVTTEKAKSGITLLKKSQQILKASSALADQNDTAQSYLIKDSSELARIEEEAIRLSNSDDPADRFQLWWKQLKDPRYTREYNSLRQNKLIQTHDTMNTMVSMKQQAYARQLEIMKKEFDINNAELDLSLLPIKQRLEMASLIREQGDNVVKSLAQAVQIRAGMISQTRTMQDNVIQTLTDDQVKQAQLAAKNSPTGNVNVAGVDIPLGVLDTAAAARDERNYLNLNRENEKKASDARAAALRQQRYVQTLSTGELDRLVLNGGVIQYEDGTKETVDLDMVKKTRDIKGEAETRSIADQANLAGIGSGDQMVLQHYNSVKQMPDPPAGSALWNTKTAYENMIRMAAQTLQQTKPGSPEFYDVARLAYNGLAIAKQKLDSAVEDEAKKLGAGSAFRTAVAKEKLLGNPAPSDLIEKEILDRLPKGQSSADIIGGTESAALAKDYQNALAQLREDSMKSGVGGFLEDSATQKQQAAAIAYQRMIRRKAQVPSDAAIKTQVMDSGNPLFGRIAPDEFWALNNNANRIGEQEFAQKYGLDAQAYARFRNGEVVNGVSTRTHGQELMILQSSALFDQIATRFDSGTAQDVAEWWANPGSRAYIERFVNTVTENSASKPTSEYVGAGIVAATVKSNLDSWGAMAQAGIQDFMNDRVVRQVADFRSFGNNPQNFQVSALTADESLSDLDRQDAWKLFIGPLVEEAKAKNLNYVDANMMIEQGLRNANPQDPQGKAALKRIMKGRQDALKKIEDVLNLQMANTNPFSPIGVPRLGFDTAKANLSGPNKWYETMKWEEAEKTKTLVRGPR